MNKRENLLSLLDDTASPDRVPAAFFLHFDQRCHSGQAAIDKHLEFFRYTDMDFVKIQYEKKFPALTSIQKPADWATMPCYGREFYQDQLDVVAGLVKEAKQEALILMTLYSPFMCAGHSVGKDVLVQHMQEDPDATNKGMAIITESLLVFVRACIEMGVDGFYASTQGGEQGRFVDSGVFSECVKPFDLAIWDVIDSACPFNILHVCDYALPYADLSPFLDYPGHVVNTNLKLADREMTAREVAKLFGRPYMGGLDRHGVLVSGTHDEIRQEATAALSAAPDKFILAADCTVPSEISWDNLKAAIATAHAHRM